MIEFALMHHDGAWRRPRGQEVFSTEVGTLLGLNPIVGNVYAIQFSSGPLTDSDDYVPGEGVLGIDGWDDTYSVDGYSLVKTFYDEDQFPLNQQLIDLSEELGSLIFYRVVQG